MVVQEMLTNIRIWALLSEPRPWWGVSHDQPKPWPPPGLLAHSLDLLGIFIGPPFMLRTISDEGNTINHHHLLLLLLTMLPLGCAVLTTQTQHLPGLPRTLDMGAHVLLLL